MRAYNPKPPTADQSASPTMDAWERQQVFREMTVSMLRHGSLSPRRRKILVQYAANLAIKPVLAGRLIEQARRLAPPHLAATPRQCELRIAPPPPSNAPLSFLGRVGVLLTGVVLLLLVVRC